ncbi:MAG: dienelactone hydrolase family protein [Clostridia bacterium]|nr:dienelactone hydrolase family protein [Clostridia bacterium]
MRKIATFLLVLSFIVAPLTSAHEDTISNMVQCESAVAGIKYWLYTPKNTTTEMPLIVYLHGGSGKGSNLNLITDIEGFPMYVKQGEISDIPAYIIFPQCPSTVTGWSDIANNVVTLVNEIISAYKIDATRIGLTGHSMGGKGTWDIALSHSELFKRIAPMSGGITLSDVNTSILSQIPVWAFVGMDDTIVKPDTSISMIDSLQEAGGNAQITKFENAGHFDVPALAYKDTNIDIVNWLIADNPNMQKHVATDSTLGYWLYTPKNATANMPLIVYLHGGSGKGTDLELITAVNGFPKYIRNGKIEEVSAYILFPQCSGAGWSNIKKSFKSLVDKTVTAYNIDKDRISLTGHSMGGTGTWNLALSYPELFSRIAPMSGGITNSEDNVTKLSSISIWAFVGMKDTIVSPQGSIDIVEGLQSINASAQITKFENADHFAVPSLGYLDESINIVQWLIKSDNEPEIVPYIDNKSVKLRNISSKYIFIAALYKSSSLINVSLQCKEEDCVLSLTNIVDSIGADTIKLSLWDKKLQPMCGVISFEL